MIHLPVFESINLENETLQVKITEQRRMKKSFGSELHWHEAIEFYFILDGGVEVLCNGNKQWLYCGDSAYISWCDLHRGVAFLDNTLFLTVQIDLSSFDISKLSSQFKSVPTFIYQYKDLINQALLLQKEYTSNDPAKVYMIKSILFRILGLLLRLESENKESNSTTHPDSLNLVRRILLFITDNCDKQITLDDLSRELAVTKSHLCRVFKSQTGQTINHYINEVRCLKALSLIQNGKSYTEACYNSGFNDYNYFSRVFKKIFGESPRHYIQKKR